MGKRNTSTPVDDQPSPRLASDAETYAEKTSTEEVEPRLLSNHSLFHDQRNPFAPITSSMLQPQLLPNHNLGFDPRYKFPDDNSPMEVESRLLSNGNLVSDDQRNHFAPITSSMVEPQLQSNHSKEFDPRNHFVPNTSSMLLPHQNLDSLMVRMNMLVRPQLLSNHNMVFDAMNHSAPCTSSMVEPQLLSNQNMGFDPINHSASITSSMVESQLLSNQNLVSDYSRNYFVPNTSSMVAHDQLLSNHNFFSDPRNNFAPNTCLMEHPQPVAELFAQFTAIFGRYLLNYSSVSAPQWPINPQGSYSSLYSDGASGSNCPLSSRFHGGLEDAWIARISRINILKKQLDKTLPTDNINAFMDEQSVDIPLDLN
ncbi:hypothetical protein Pint_30977 [Pistacia integerrima]|uniref:Uncharacterized protein n=1 Tax=Pistacia integerrima TaxID=434235 RepID=A0ACC0XNX2_9ROSI|nr:hypothetical protein Pint_30977 [Pistacia integerrima]